MISFFPSKDITTNTPVTTTITKSFVVRMAWRSVGVCIVSGSTWKSVRVICSWTSWFPRQVITCTDGWVIISKWHYYRTLAVPSSFVHQILTVDQHLSVVTASKITVMFTAKIWRVHVVAMAKHGAQNLSCFSYNHVFNTPFRTVMGFNRWCWCWCCYAVTCTNSQVPYVHFWILAQTQCWTIFDHQRQQRQHIWLAQTWRNGPCAKWVWCTTKRGGSCFFKIQSTGIAKYKMSHSLQRTFDFHIRARQRYAFRNNQRPRVVYFNIVVGGEKVAAVKCSFGHQYAWRAGCFGDFTVLVQRCTSRITSLQHNRGTSNDMQFASVVAMQTANYGRSVCSQWYAFRIDSQLGISFHFNSGDFKICFSLFNNVCRLCCFAIVVVQQQIISPIGTIVGTVTVYRTGRTTRTTAPIWKTGIVSPILPTITTKRCHTGNIAADTSLSTTQNRNTPTTTTSPLSTTGGTTLATISGNATRARKLGVNLQQNTTTSATTRPHIRTTIVTIFSVHFNSTI